MQRSEGEVQVVAGEGDREGGKLQGMYPDDGTGQYKYTLLKPTHNAALAIETLVLGMKKIVSRYSI